MIINPLVINKIKNHDLDVGILIL